MSLWYPREIARPIFMTIMVLSCISPVIAFYTLMTTRSVRASTFSTIVKNKFIIILFVMSVSFFISNVAQLAYLGILYYADEGYNLKDTAMAHDAIQALFYNLGVGMHIGALYLRTDSSLIRNNWVKVVRVMLALFAIAGVSNLFVSLARPNMMAVMTFTASTGIAFGLSLLSIDIIYTVAFLSFVLKTRKALGASKTTFTSIIATQGLKMTSLSIVALVLYAAWATTDHRITYTLWCIQRLIASIVNLMWTRLKHMLDEAKERERSSAAATYKLSQQALISRSKKKTSQLDKSEADVADSVQSKKDETTSHVAVNTPSVAKLKETDLTSVRIRTRTKSVDYSENQRQISFSEAVQPEGVHDTGPVGTMAWTDEERDWVKDVVHKSQSNSEFDTNASYDSTDRIQNV